MNTPVNYKLAKLLKEKGFEQKERPSYLLVDFSQTNVLKTNPENISIGDLIGYYVPNKTVNAPTIAEVVMWLYEKHGIWIYAERYSTLFRCYAEEIGDERFGKWEGHKYESPTEAYEAAIQYTLTKLI